MRYDAVVLGGGHNGLAAAAYLARAGRRVLLLERGAGLGGAAVSTTPFPGVDARLSRYSYLVSLLPPHVLADLDLDVRLARRRVSSYTPVPGNPATGLLVADDHRTAASLAALTGGTRAYAGWRHFHERVTRLAGRVFPTLTQPLLRATEVRDLAADDALWSGLVERPLGRLLDDWFPDDLVRGVVATDALIGTFSDLYAADLRQNVCFLYHVVGGGTGDWDVPVGGMGAVSGALVAAARTAGADLRTGCRVTAVDPVSGEVTWQAPGGRQESASGEWLACGFAPAVLDGLLTTHRAGTVASGPVPEGAQVKANLVLRRLPALRDRSVPPEIAFAGTFHVNESASQLAAAAQAAAAGRLPDPLPLDVYCHTLTDRSILGPSLAARDGGAVQTLTVFGLQTPARLFRPQPGGGTPPVTAAQARAAVLSSLESVLAERVEPLLLTGADGNPCLEVRTPVDLEADLAMPGGDIFHRPLQWPWAEAEGEVGTWGVSTAYERLVLAGAGARRGGGVSAIPGHNAARHVLEAG